jgi:hypothetical protein
VAWHHPMADKIYDCSSSTCSQQALPVGAGQWGSPYRIYLLDGIVGDPIYFGDSVYFDRMLSSTFSADSSLHATYESTMGGGTMSTRTVFVIRSADRHCSTPYRYWRFDVVRDGTDGHTCLKAFRFARADGSLSAPARGG